jgi:hypothetical protein
MVPKYFNKIITFFGRNENAMSSLGQGLKGCVPLITGAPRGIGQMCWYGIDPIQRKILIKLREEKGKELWEV